MKRAAERTNIPGGPGAKDIQGDQPENVHPDTFHPEDESIIVPDDKYEFGFSFSAQEGALGDESEDNGDLPKILREGGNRYDPTMSDGGKQDDDGLELEEGMHEADEDEIGIAYREDSYTEESDSDDEEEE